MRLPLNYNGELPSQMFIMDVLEAEYVIFKYEPFDYEKENSSIEEKIEESMKNFDVKGTDYCFDITNARIMYFYYNPEKYFKYIKPVKKQRN